MPIIIKDFEWSESDVKLDISLPQKSIKSSNIDVMCTERYVKVNYSPYFFELHLKDKIDDNKTRVVLEKSEITLYLTKCSPGLWGEVSNPAAKDKAIRRELVAAAYKYHEDKTKGDTEERAKVKAEQNRWALRRAMDQDSSEKDRIETVKQSERDKVSREMDEWQSMDEDTRQQNYIMSIKENARKDTTGVHEVPTHHQPTYSEPTIDTACTRKLAADERAVKFDKIKHNLSNPLKGPEQTSPAENTMWEVNGPRQKREIEVSFSPRYFPSAARESLALQEQEWMEKNVKAMTVIKPADGDTKDEERSPLWLKDKACVFYKTGNFPAAINAYSEAIKISPNLPSLYINRASCYILLHLFDDCISDCTRALELLNPPAEANRLSRVRALAKRGSAYFQREKIKLALADYQLASRLQPDDTALKQDMEIILGHPQGLVT